MYEFALSQGKLSERPLAALLWIAYRQNATGELRISTAAGENRVFFSQGAPTVVRVSVGFRSLTEILVQHSLVDLDAIDCALPHLEAGRTLPDVLLEQKAIQHHFLSLGRQLQQEAHLRHLAELREGDWEFTCQAIAHSGQKSLHPQQMLIEALHSSSAEPWIAQILNDRQCLALHFVDFPKLHRWLRFFRPGDHERKAIAALREAWHWSDLVSLGINSKWARRFASAMLLLEVARPFDGQPRKKTLINTETFRALEKFKHEEQSIHQETFPEEIIVESMEPAVAT